jgi:hypothetical protein
MHATRPAYLMLDWIILLILRNSSLRDFLRLSVLSSFVHRFLSPPSSDSLCLCTSLKVTGPILAATQKKRQHFMYTTQHLFQLTAHMIIKNYAFFRSISPSRYSDSLRAGQSGDRIPVGARFSAPVQIGPGIHPASYTVFTGSLCWRQSGWGRSVNHTHPHLAPKLTKE